MNMIGFVCLLHTPPATINIFTFCHRCCVERESKCFGTNGPISVELFSSVQAYVYSCAQ